MVSDSQSESGTVSTGDLIEVRLIAIRYAARDTNLFELAKPDGAPLPAVEPGAHVDLNLPNGMVRQYSLVNSDSYPTRYILGVKRDAAGRGGSALLHDQIKVGATLRISPPRNNFPLVENADHVVLIAGGIGITPIFAMVQRLRESGRSFTLHYAARSRQDAAFVDELSDVAEASLHFDNEAGGPFQGIEEIVTDAPAGAHFYCCGPAQMLETFEAATRDISSELIHVEYFTPKEEAALDGGFIVELASSGGAYSIAAGQSILDVLCEAGIDVTYSCTEGICGACETKVISGTPDHRDSILTADEKAAGKTMMVCCSGSQTPRLVLDL